MENSIFEKEEKRGRKPKDKVEVEEKVHKKRGVVKKLKR